MVDLLSLALMILCGVTVAYVVLQPISKATKAARPLERFFIVDIISLIVLLQLPLSFLAVVSQMRGPGEVAITGAFLVLIVIAIWWRGVSILSSLLIFQNARRLIFIVVVLPVALLGSMATYPMFRIAVDAIQNNFEVDTNPNLLLGSFLGLLFLPVAVYYLRKLTRWVLDAPKHVGPEVSDATVDPFLGD